MSKRTLFLANAAAVENTWETAEARGAQDPGRKPRRWYDDQTIPEHRCIKAGHSVICGYCKQCDRFV